MAEFKKCGEFATVWVGGLGLLQCEEIVRCKDCEFAGWDGKWCVRINEFDDSTWFAVEPNGFCAWGVRRVDE